MKTLAILNQKGGVGKTTTALALWAGLTLQGKKVLAVDLDPQGNLSFTAAADTSGRTAFGVLLKETAAADAIQHTTQGALIPSSPELAGADMTITRTGKEYRLKEALEPVAGAYDYAVIDTPPALGILTVNALAAADYAIIPAMAEVFSLQGVGQLADTINPVRTYCNPSLEIAGILLTRYSPRTVLARDVADMAEVLAEKLSTHVFRTRIRDGVAVREAQMRQENLFTYAPKSGPALDYLAFLSELLPVVEG